MPDIFIHPQKNESPEKDSKQEETPHQTLRRGEAHYEQPHHEQSPHGEPRHPIHTVEKPHTQHRERASISNLIPRPHKLGLFSTFVRDPMGIVLAEQHEDEHILLFIRRAFITNTPWIIFSLILLFLPPFFSILTEPFHLPMAILSPFTETITILFYYMIVCGYILINFVTWFYDIGIVTEKRAVDIDFYNISFVSVATARVQDLKDVRYAQKGFFESLFDYGDIVLSVEATGEMLTYENTPHPAEVVSMLSILIGGHQER